MLILILILILIALLLSSAVLGERLATDTTSKFAIEEKVIILQILILIRACRKANLCQAVAGHPSLAIRDGRS
jgi:hypothetical protein